VRINSSPRSPIFTVHLENIAYSMIVLGFAISSRRYLLSVALSLLYSCSSGPKARIHHRLRTSCIWFVLLEAFNLRPCSVLYQINKLVEDEALGSYNVFPITAATKDLDPKFSNALASMTIDVEGKLVRSLTLSGMFLLLIRRIVLIL